MLSIAALRVSSSCSVSRSLKAAEQPYGHFMLRFSASATADSANSSAKGAA